MKEEEKWREKKKKRSFREWRTYVIEGGNWGDVGDTEKGRNMWERNWRASKEPGVTMRRAEELVWSAKGEEK